MKQDNYTAIQISQYESLSIQTTQSDYGIGATVTINDSDGDHFVGTLLTAKDRYRH